MTRRSISVDLSTQALLLHEGEAILRKYVVSTAKNGAGEMRDSECTPRGRHIIRAKIGASLPYGAVLVSRRPTGEICSDDLYLDQPDRDWMLSRILWLSGVERGRNRLGNVDTMQRYIYIHGCPEQVQLGVPTSHGCIRMRNREVIELFELVETGTEVVISEGDNE
ncbi:MAG: L,D-transpeptidase [Gammaproteobacteria bacterium]